VENRNSIPIAERKQVIARLGGKCQNPDCQWVNADGSRGCTDVRCLHVEQKDVPSKDRGWDKYAKMLKDPNFFERYQVLCANCNWIKRATDAKPAPQRQTRFIDGLGWQIKVGKLWVPFQHHGKEALTAEEVLASATVKK
jgi:hypothetical protein